MENPHRQDYTKSAFDIYKHTKYKAWGFKKNQKLDTWLKMSWSILFNRQMTEFDIRMLSDHCHKLELLDFKVENHEKGLRSLKHEERIKRQGEFIGADGYLYKRKVMFPLADGNPKETKRLGGLLKKQKEFNETRDRLEKHFKKVNSIIWKGKKYRIDKWKI